MNWRHCKGRDGIRHAKRIRGVRGGIGAVKSMLMMRAKREWQEVKLRRIDFALASSANICAQASTRQVLQPRDPIRVCSKLLVCELNPWQGCRDSL